MKSLRIHIDEPGTIQPNVWKNIILISKATSYKYYDVMVAYDEDINNNGVFLGHWNDGFVEQ